MKASLLERANLKHLSGSQAPAETLPSSDERSDDETGAGRNSFPGNLEEDL